MRATSVLTASVSAAVLSRAFTGAPAVIHTEAYANNLTGLIPDLYQAVDVVSRELVGAIPSVFRNVSGERAAVDEEIVYPVVPQQTSQPIVPSMSVPEPRDQNIGNGKLKITKAEAVEFGWTGEEQKGLNNGVGAMTIQADQFAQGLRTLTNMIEADVCNAGYRGASRAWGTAGTAPFASGIGDAAQLRKILDDNGAPATGRSAIIDTSAGANMRTNMQLTKANEAGTTMTLRDGQLLDISGISYKESAGIVQHVAGTAALATTNNAGYDVGARVITLASAGTGTVLTGDVVSFAGDANKYVVVSGDTDVSGGGTITIAAPGLRRPIPAAATAITLAAASSRGFAFSQNAIHLICRAPALPQGGDAAIDATMLTDPRSGISFEVRLYAGYRKIRAEVGAAWGTDFTKSEHIAALLG